MNLDAIRERFGAAIGEVTVFRGETSLTVDRDCHRVSLRIPP